MSIVRYFKFVCILSFALAALALIVEADQSVVDETLPPRLDQSVNIPLAEPQSSFQWDEQVEPQQMSLMRNELWSKMVYQSFAPGNWEIYIYNPGDMILYKKLTYNLASDVHPRLNRGATKIVFASDRDGDYELYLMNSDGTGVTQLTHNATDDVNPDWSPDGTRIVFQAYRDGQPEIYVMNADGSNQQRLTADADYDGSPAWSPDGARIAFVSRRSGGYRIYLMNTDGSNVTRITNQPYSLDPVWSPDGGLIAFDADGNGDGWQELWLGRANGAYQNMIFNPSQYFVDPHVDARARSWTPDGEEIGITNVFYTEYYGVWYWTRTYMSNALPKGGAISTIDASGNLNWHPGWQTTDADAPRSQVAPLPEYSPVQDFQVHWSGADVGPSGLSHYDVQYRVGTDLEWTDWFTGTRDTEAPFTATPGTSVYFRCRARDNHYNWENWPDEADAWTTFYTWQFSGEVTDNQGLPLGDVAIGVSPPPIASVTTDAQGQYVARLAETGTHTLTVEHPGYAPLPPTPLYLQNVASAYLAPRDNLIQNGDFEQQLAYWTVNGTLPITLDKYSRHTGTFGVKVVADCSYPCPSADELSLSQAVIIPADMLAPVLAFKQRFYGGAPYDNNSGLEVLVDNGTAVMPVDLVESTGGAWSHTWANLQAWAGQAVTITFRLNQAQGDPPLQIALDDISLGSAYPDLWVTVSNSPASALPGEEVLYTIQYGNQSNIRASGGVITFAWPAELELTSVSHGTASTLVMSPLVLTVGDLAPNLGPYTINVTATVKLTATLLTTATTSVEIGSVSSELKLMDNQDETRLLIGYANYLPLVLKID